MEHYEMEVPVDELMIEAIITETPLVIVEGLDDISVYENIANYIQKEVQVVAVENIRGFNEGCENVIGAIEKIQDLLVEDVSNKKYILGIIDRDSRYYRNTIPILEGLFILKYYSYESHFVGEKSLESIVPILTNSYEGMIDFEVIKCLQEGLNERYEELYYVSLEALKNACDATYSGVVGYSYEAGRIFGNRNSENIPSKINRGILDGFALENNITRYDIKKIAKGKWLLYVYTKLILENIVNLHNKCSSAEINQCQYCKTGKYQKCLFKIKNNFKINQVEALLLQNFNWEELKYIEDRFKLLA